MVKRENYNIVSEAIVEDLLKKHYHKKPKKISRTGPGKIGDFRVGKKIVEVKGVWSDEIGKDLDYEYVSRNFTISDKEWKKINDDPKNFELWVIYRLAQEHKDVKGWPVRYAIMQGTTLKKCKSKFYKVTLSITKERWKEAEQHDVPLEIWNKHKTKKQKKRNV